MLTEPAGQCAPDYFAVIDFKALSDSELVEAKDLAAKFIGTQAVAISEVHKEMAARFTERTKSSFEDRLKSAEARSMSSKSAGSMAMKNPKTHNDDLERN